MAMPGATGLGDILSKTLENLGLSPKAQKYRVFSIWAKIVGDISRHAKPRRLQGDVLFVATASSVWSQELTFMRETILSRLNNALGGPHIREIRFSEHLWGAQDGGPTERRNGDAWQGGEDGSGGSLDQAEDGLPAGANGREAGRDIGDPALSRAFRRVARVMVRRKQSLLATGYKLCRTCGHVYPGDKGECPACRLKRESWGYARAIAILDKQPETANSDLSRLAELYDPWLVERARREAESRLVSSIRYHLAAATRAGTPISRLGEPARAELVPAIRKLAALRSFMPTESMGPEDVEKAVGRRLAAIAKKE